VLSIRSDRWEVGEIVPRVVEDNPTEVLLTNRGRIRAEWQSSVRDIAVSYSMVRRWVVANAASIGVEPALQVAPTMIGLRRRAPSDAGLGLSSVRESARTISDFRVSSDGSGAHPRCRRMRLSCNCRWIRSS
jgi:hypothetical protein